MNILMLSPVWPFTADSGGRVRIYNLFKGISRYSNVTLVAPQGIARCDLRNTKSEIFLNKVNNTFSWIQKVKAIFSIYPYHISLFHSNQMRVQVKSLLEKETFSLVYCHLLHTLPYVRNCNLPIVLDPQNVDREYWKNKVFFESSVSRRFLSEINMYKTMFFEDQYLDKVKAIISVSEVDDLHTRMYAKNKVQNFFIAPNGVDIEKYVPPVRETLEKDPHAIRIGFMGSLDLDLNQRAALMLIKDILPLVRKDFPNRKILVSLVGRNPPASLFRLASSLPNIELSGTVPDVLPYLAQMDVFVAPLFGGAGTKLRVLEALAMELPIVASPDAVKGIEKLENGTNISIASTVFEFSKKIGDLIRNENVRRIMGKAGRKLVLEKYSWNKITDDLSKILASLSIS